MKPKQKQMCGYCGKDLDGMGHVLFCKHVAECAYKFGGIGSEPVKPVYESPKTDDQLSLPEMRAVSEAFVKTKVAIAALEGYPKTKEMFSGTIEMLKKSLIMLATEKEV